MEAKTKRAARLAGFAAVGAALGVMSPFSGTPTRRATIGGAAGLVLGAISSRKPKKKGSS